VTSLAGESPGVRLAPVEIEPRLDVSRPTALRASGFLLITVGAVILGVGAIVPWLTVGIPNESGHSSFRGTELPDGRVVLGCALVVLVAIATIRLVRSRRVRHLIAVVTAAAGLVSVVVGVTFIDDGQDRSSIVAAIGVPRELWERFGVFRDLGAGPYLALVGGLLCVAGAILTLWWIRRMGDWLAADEVSPAAASG
jgi:Tryptophan-associated transmembrane protein (Trp_oprn_chp)